MTYKQRFIEKHERQGECLSFRELKNSVEEGKLLRKEIFIFLIKVTMNTKNIVLLIIALGLIGGLYYYKMKHKPTVERTFAFIKPDAVSAGYAPEILEMIKSHGFTIIKQKELSLEKPVAEDFYAVHKEKPFFPELVTYITSGPVIALVLEKNNAVQAWRDLMGATNPEKAVEGTIRKKFGKNIQQNAVHGSDSVENAQKEIHQFFTEL